MDQKPGEQLNANPERRALAALIAAGILLELLYFFAWRPLAQRFAPSIPPEEHPFLMFLGLWIVSFLVYFAAIWFARRSERAAVVVPFVILCAVAFRLTLWQTPPILEDDIYRYLWDGRVTDSGGNPFRFAPEEVAQFNAWEGVQLPSGARSRDEVCRMAREEIALLAEADGLSPDDLSRLARLQELSRRERIALAEVAKLWDTEQYRGCLLAINYPDVPTIYPPVAQWVFAAAHRIHPMSLSAMKGIVIGFDILAILLTVVLLRMLNRDPSWCIVYAWSPLAVKEFANSGHCDAIAVCFVVLAVILVLRRRRILSGAAFALGFLVKMFPLLLLPVAWKRIRWRGAIAFAVVVVAAYIPFVGFGVPEMFQGFAAYADRWEFNSGLFTLCEKSIAERILHPPYRTLDLILARQGEELRSLSVEITPFLVTKLAVGVVFLILLWALHRRDEGEDVDFVRRVFFVIGALLLLSPVANAWYFCWLLPFLCVFPRRSWLALTCLLVFAYAYFLPNSAAADGPLWDCVIRPIVSHIPIGPRSDAALWQGLPEPERNLQLHIWWRTFGVRFVEYVPFLGLLLWEIVSTWRSGGSQAAPDTGADGRE